jgi:hypothetical protein
METSPSIGSQRIARALMTHGWSRTIRGWLAGVALLLSCLPVLAAVSLKPGDGLVNRASV